MELSLDEIIQKKQANNAGGRKKKGKKNMEQLNVGSNINSNARQGKIGDARLKIIEKKRGKLRDARDKLAELAKMTDARQKLRRIRMHKSGILDSVETRGGNIVVQTGPNGRLALTTKKRLPIPPPFPPPFLTDDPIPPLILRTVSNRDALPLPLPRASLAPPPPPSPYKWVRTGSSFAPDPSLTLTRTVVGNRSHKRRRPGMAQGREWDEDATVAKRVKPITIRNSRSESPDSPGRSLSHRRSPDKSADAMPPGGFKVVVSNLQSSVTQEDITELFADIGTLRRAQLVKPGLAEVAFVNRSDAVRAVDVYHNRQLDGRPMKCTLVTTATYAAANTARRTSSSPTSLAVAPSPVVVQTVTSAGQSCLRSSSGASMDLPTGGKCAVTPDVATIHKALFNKKGAAGSYAATGAALRPAFTVTLPKSKQGQNN